MMHFCPAYVPPKLRPSKPYQPPVHRARRTEQESVLEALVLQGNLSQDELAMQVRRAVVAGGGAWPRAVVAGGCRALGLAPLP
jgi:hypothetical protein